MTPLLLKRLLDPKPTPTLLLEKLRQQSGQQQQGPYSHSNISTQQQQHHLRSHSSCGTQNSAASVMTLSAAAGMPSVLSAGRGSSSVGELSLWSEPLNVSPVSPHRSAAALGSPGAMPSRAEGSFLLPDRPQSPTVLAMLGTDRNIAPAVVTAEGVAGCCNADGAPCHIPLLRFGSSSPEQHRAGCRTRSCSPTAYRADAGQQQQHGAASRSRSSSPQSQHLICCACRRQHSLQQHSKCCHLCGSCCKGRATCGGKGSCGGSIIGSGRAGPLQAGTWPAEAAGSADRGPFGCRPGSLAAEGSASSTSTCPCVKAYRSGQRDGMPAETSSPVQQTAGGVSPCQHQQPQQLLSRHHSRAGAPPQLNSSSGGLGDVPVGGLEPACASAGQYSEAGSMAAARPEVADARQGRGQGQDDLVQAAFLEVYAAQQNLMAQGPAADPDDIQELTQILQQVLPAAEPQHEALLKEVMARQQQLLALQERYTQEAEDGPPWSHAEAPPLRLPSGLGKDRPASGTAPSQQGQQEQQQGPSRGGGQGYEGLSTRTNSGSSNWTGGTSAQRPSTYACNNPPDHLQAYMSQQDRLAAAAVAYGAFEGGQKPLLQVLDASRGTAGSRSSRGRFASGTSAVEPHTSQASAQQLLPRGQQQDYGRNSVQHSRRSTFEGEPVPAYTGGGSDLDLAELHSRPLVHFMTAEGGSSSRHVVQEAPSQVSACVRVGIDLTCCRLRNLAAACLTCCTDQSHVDCCTWLPCPSQVRGSCPGFDSVDGNMRAVEAAAAAAAADRAPSNRSIADSAWSVQATPPASFNGGQQQAVHCSTAVHAARDPEPWLSSVCFSTAPAAAPIGPAGQAGAAAGSMHRRAASSSLVDQVSAVVPPLNLGGALDTETAKLAGIAVDPRVMGLSPRLRGVDSASCLQELAAAVSGNGTERPDSRGRSSSTDAGSDQELLQRRVQESVGGSAPSPRTPGRHLAGAGSSPLASASAADPAAAGGGHQADVSHSRCDSLSHSTRSASVRFQESPSGQQLSYPGSSRVASMSAGHTQQQQQVQQQMSPVRHPQDQQVKRTGSTRAGSFELPDSDPSSQEVSYRSLEGAHSQGDLSKSRQRAAAAAHAAASQGVPAALGSMPASPRPQQPLASPQHSPAVQLLGSRSPSGSMLHLHQQASAQQQQPQHACRNLSGGSSLLDLAARARVLASGGGSRHNAAPAGAAGDAANPSVQGSPTGNQPQQQQQHRQQQHTQPMQPEGEVSAAPSLPRPDSSTSWRERQLAMQQELAAQVQQLTRIRSRASSVATTPAAPGSTMRSMSRNSCVSSIASSMAGARTPRQQTQQQLLQEGATLQQQQQQQQQSRPQSRQEVQAVTGGPDGSHQQQQEQQGQQPGSSSIQAEASCSSAGDGVFDGMLDAVLCDTLQQRREARLQKQALQGWKQYVAGRAAAGCVYTAMANQPSTLNRFCPSSQPLLLLVHPLYLPPSLLTPVLQHARPRQPGSTLHPKRVSLRPSARAPKSSRQQLHRQRHRTHHSHSDSSPRLGRGQRARP